MAPGVLREEYLANGKNDAPPPLTLEGIALRRQQSAKVNTGIAAPSDVEVYKGRGQHAHKPLAKRWEPYLNEESDRQPSSLKACAKYLSKPGLISLGGGLPSSEYFPFEQFSFDVPNGPAFDKASVETLTAGKHDIAEAKSLFDISTALQYGSSMGAAQLLRFVTEHTELVHHPPYADWSCCLSIGSTSSWDMILRALYKPNICLLTEEYSFASAMETARGIGYKAVGVAMDEQGLLPAALDRVLATWDPSEHGGSPKPYLLYTVPSGQNPTGATQSLQRRKDIYAVAQEHDLLIVEDEPYYFLQMDPYTGPDGPPAPQPSTHAEFLAALVPSLLSLDVDGRVLRLDSFSKVVSPGARVGWITGPKHVTDRYWKHADVSTQSPSGFSQLMLYKLLDEHWGHAGYLDWLLHVRREYTRRRDVLLAACAAHLPSIVKWKPPMAGMFHWLAVDWTRHPLAGQVGKPGGLTLAQLEERIFLRSIDAGALLMRGSWFAVGKGEAAEAGHGAGAEAAEPEAVPGAPDGAVPAPEAGLMFFRCTYAAAPFGQMDEAVRRFGAALRAEFELDD